MDLENFLSSAYQTKKFEGFITDVFYGFESEESSLTDDDLSESEKEHIKSYRYLGKVELDDDSEIGFFEFVSTSPNIENKRVGYSNILKKLAKEYMLDGAIASFYHPKSSAWRLSFVGFEYDGTKANVTNLKRYTYVLGADVAIKTPLFQLKKLKHPQYEEIEEAFSVEAITKEFYTQYKTLFEDVNRELESQHALFSNGDSDSSIEARKFSRKLLGRITFLYFLQKKGWLGVKKKWGDGDKNFLQNIFLNHQGDFYSEVLTPLFFTALNTQREDDYLKLLDCKIPFLNGGLFTRESYDDDRIILSNELFKKLFEVFNQYNFTVIEDLPHDSEVAIDPEMLGRVFENLIEENYRKGKGAFYTPREIVHYMCQESIVMYLSNSFEKEYVELLVKSGEVDSEYIQKNKEEIRKSLFSMKVLDPAIGSGAFPMGMLHEVIQILSHLDKSHNSSEDKKEIIENSIFGIDIDASAVDIAKLRFWLSIIVDEEKPFPLPNLAFKIMQGNSLIETIDSIDPIPTNISEPKTKKEQKQLFGNIHQSWDFDKVDVQDHIVVLRKKLHQFFNSSENSKKKSIEKEIFLLIKNILEQKVDELSNQISTLQGNLATEKLKTETSAVDKKVKKITDDIFQKESTLLKINALKDKPINNELFLYKLWFGEILKDGGFDVVIGNPPYLRVQGIDREISEQYKKSFDSATGSYDLYVLFVEKALALLSDNGILNYIMPHKWVNASFGKGLRELSQKNLKKLISFDAYQVFNASTYTSLLWLSKKQNKEFSYVELDKDLQTNRELENYLNSLEDDDYTYIKTKELSGNAWVLTNKQTYEILKHLNKQPLKIQDVFEKIFTGLQTSKDSVYFLKRAILKDGIFIAYSDELEKVIEIEEALVKPLLKGDDVHRYEKLETDKLVVFPYYKILEDDKEKAILYTEDELKENFPKGYAYLKECENILRGREKGKFSVDGEWYQYGRKQGIVSANKEKLMQPDISLGGNFSYDTNGEFYSTTTLYGYLKYENVEESYKFYMSVFNSKLLWWYLLNTGTTLANGYFRYKPTYLNNFSLPKIKNIEDTKPFEILVDYVMFLKASREIDNFVDNKYIAKLFEDVLDAMVYELYFTKEFKKNNIEFISYAKEYFKPIENLDDDKKIDIINISYQLLREKDNEIRNNLQLMPIRVPMITPIMKSI
ncbi:MAG: Eco57I restriction-modification methylase domain-containing protein [Campylobacterota bacterium]|nr:Eco57I restriction-modification methylase domain-containing protein [Campylobacterota bacterium]